MFGRIALLIIVVLAFFAVRMGIFQTSAQDPTREAAAAENTTAPAVALGADLYAARTPPPPPSEGGATAEKTLAADPIVIGDCRLVVIEKEEVPSQRDGVILFIGSEIKPGEQVPEDRLIKIKIGDEEKQFRRLKEDDTIEPGQLLAQLDDRQARDEYAIKKTKIEIAEAELSSAEKGREEAKLRYDTLRKIRKTDDEEVRERKLAWDKLFYEHISKYKSFENAKLEFNQSQTNLGMHQIRSSIKGVIKTIYKNPGEAVKSAPTYEPVFQIRNLEKLRAEGLVEVQHLPYLRKGMKVVIEPTFFQGPEQTLVGHLQEISDIAVSRDGKILSASLDGTVRVWDRLARRELRILRHPGAVRAVACAPADAPANWCVSGAADGSIRLWNLGDNDAPRVLEDRHRGSVNCVAFSPDGAAFATGGDDREICLWDTASGKLKYRLLGHSGSVTSLQFTPQVQLVSAARDNTLRLWKLGTQAGRLETTIDRRSGDVTHLGVRPDGQRVLFDPWQSKGLRILSLPEGLTEGVLQSPTGASQFTTLALYSPDTRLILTAGASEGRLQIWRAPARGIRAYGIRQLVSSERSHPTCAAFASDGSFLVSGTRDRNVLIWPVPSRQEVEHQLIAEITNIERALDSNQVRIWAELSTGGTLLPGATVTMVRYPKD